jgi:hypothetical protein
MKKLWYLSVFVISIFVSVIISLFVGVNIHAYDPSEKEEIYGTWINPKYGQEGAPQKIIIDPNGTWKRFYSRHDLATGLTGPFTLTDKWIDSEGNIWYKMFWTMGNIEWKMYELIRISNSGKVLEYVFSEVDFPKGITVDYPDYRIYYRQE